LVWTPVEKGGVEGVRGNRDNKLTAKRTYRVN
jgi:hypothetical protein